MQDSTGQVPVIQTCMTAQHMREDTDAYTSEQTHTRDLGSPQPTGTWHSHPGY